MESVEKVFMSAEEVAEAMNISKAYAYKVIQRMNKKLEQKGFLTMQGRIDRKFFTTSSMAQQTGRRCKDAGI